MVQPCLARVVPKTPTLVSSSRMKGKFCEAVSFGGQQGLPEGPVSIWPAVICALVKEETSLLTLPSTEFTTGTMPGNTQPFKKEKKDVYSRRPQSWG